MKFKCEIEKITTLKKGAKLVLAIPDEQTIKVLKDIYNFIDKPVDVEILVNDEEQAKRLKQITSGQRDKIYAILRDMEAYIGDSVENLKEKTKASFIVKLTRLAWMHSSRSITYTGHCGRDRHGEESRRNR